MDADSSRSYNCCEWWLTNIPSRPAADGTRQRHHSGAAPGRSHDFWVSVDQDQSPREHSVNDDNRPQFKIITLLKRWCTSVQLISSPGPTQRKETLRKVFDVKRHWATSTSLNSVFTADPVCINDPVTLNHPAEILYQSITCNRSVNIPFTAQTLQEVNRPQRTVAAVQTGHEQLFNMSSPKYTFTGE